MFAAGQYIHNACVYFVLSRTWYLYSSTLFYCCCCCTYVGEDELLLCTYCILWYLEIRIHSDYLCMHAGSSCSTLFELWFCCCYLQLLLLLLLLSLLVISSCDFDHTKRNCGRQTTHPRPRTAVVGYNFCPAAIVHGQDTQPPSVVSMHGVSCLTVTSFSFRQDES